MSAGGLASLGVTAVMRLAGSFPVKITTCEVTAQMAY